MKVCGLVVLEDVVYRSAAHKVAVVGDHRLFHPSVLTHSLKQPENDEPEDTLCPGAIGQEI